MKLFHLFLMLTLAQPVFGQTNPRPPVPPEVQVEQARIQAEERARHESEVRDWITRIFPVRNVTPSVLRRALSMFRADIMDEPNLGVLSVRAPKEIMPAIEEAIKMLDVPRPPTPSRTAELTVYVLFATAQPDPAAQLPSVLVPVVDQLKNVMAYKGYKLIDTIIANAGADLRPASSGGILPPLYRSSGRPSEYRFFSQLRVDPREGKPVLLVRDMQFSVTVDIGNAVANPGLAPNVAIGPAQMAQPTINTDVEIPEGQRVVVGKATLGDNALILVMSAKFLN